MSQRFALTSILPRSQSQRDGWWMLLWCICIFSVSGKLELFETLHEFIKEHEGVNLDEILTVAVTLPLAFGVFIYRRNREIRQEVEKRREVEDRLRQLAHFDGLTGLPNRSLLEERLAKAVERAERDESMLAVLFIDLDGFKQVNDVHGHLAGDSLLCEVGRRILRHIRGSDLVARIGGDEFIVLLDELNTSSEIEPVVRRLVAEIGAPYVYSDVTLSVSASIGVSVSSRQEGNGNQHLIRNADRAMYDAKAKGKNQYCFFERKDGERPA